MHRPRPADPVFWSRRAKPSPRAAALTGSVVCDIAVLGGGLTGLTCALRLAEAGRDVVLVEAEGCGVGASGRSSGFVTPDSELELSSLVARVGREQAEILWAFAEGGARWIREAIDRYGIDCDLQVQPSLLVASDAAGERRVRKEHETRRQLGMVSVLHDGAAARRRWGSASLRAAVEYPGTFAIDPYALCRGLREVLLARNVKIFEDTRVHDARPGHLVSSSGEVRAADVVVCIDHAAPALGVLPRVVSPLQTFLVVTEPLAAADLARVFPEGPVMVWDTGLVYHYLRPLGDGRLLLGGGELRSTYTRPSDESVPRVAAQLLENFHQTFPGISLRVAAAWSGQLGVSKDLLPVLDRAPGRVAVSAATGLPWAAALGGLVAETLLGLPAPSWAAFRADRRWPVPGVVQTVLGKPIAFALAHSIVKRLT